jgi:Leucine-rich repeat (LRR) protein
MLRLILSITIFSFFSSSSIAACNYCTSLEEALENPEKVFELDLRAEGLLEIPVSINKLINLKSLDLSNNLIETINYRIIRLPSLENLNLTHNPGFNTMEFAGIGECFPNLQTLNLSAVSAKYVSPDILELEELRELILSKNSIEFLPEEIGEMSKLVYLDMSENNLVDAFWLSGLWEVEYLDLSKNPKLNLESAGLALFLKDNLKTLVVSPTTDSKGLPAIFAELSLEEMVLKGGSTYTLDPKLARSESIQRIVIDDVKINDPDRFNAWVNKFTQLTSIEYKNMVVPAGLDDINAVREMRFVNCTFANKSELKTVKNNIAMIAIGTNIITPGYIGNAKITKPEDAIADEDEIIQMNDEMRENTLKPIVESQAQILKIDGSSPQRVSMGFSSYDIPSDAFLTQDGQNYTGEVELNITEYNDPIENALSGVPMIYRKDGTNNIFASSGMIDFRAYDDQGNELAPNPNSIIQVELRDSQPSETPELYAFNDSTSNWETDGSLRPSGFALRKKQFLDSLNKIPDDQIVNFKDIPIGITMAFKKSRLDPYTLNFDVVGRTKSIKSMKSFKNDVYTGNVDQRWVAKKNAWHIDTIMTDEIKELLHQIKKDQKKTAKSWNSNGRLRRAS